MKRKLAVLVPWDSPFMWTKPAFNLMNLEVPEGWQLRYISGAGWCPATRHNNAMARGLNWGANALYFHGGDHVVDEDILVKLIGHLEDGWDMATGWIPSRGMFGIKHDLPFPNLAFKLKDGVTSLPGPMPVLDFDQENMELIHDDDAPSQEIHMIGTGSLMLKCEVVKDMKRPWFQEVIRKDGFYGRFAVQDSYFVYRCCVENGFRLWLDTTIKQYHIDAFPIDKTFKERFKDKTGGPYAPMMGVGFHELERGTPDGSTLAESFHIDGK